MLKPFVQGEIMGRWEKKKAIAASLKERSLSSS
jgi:hypothetical protein